MLSGHRAAPWLLHETLCSDANCGVQAALREAGISVLGGDRAAPRMGLGPAPSARIEYGSNTLTLELVSSMDEAIDHIHAHGSSHTEAIITGASLLSWQRGRRLPQFRWICLGPLELLQPHSVYGQASLPSCQGF